MHQPSPRSGINSITVAAQFRFHGSILTFVSLCIRLGTCFGSDRTTFHRRRRRGVRLEPSISPARADGISNHMIYKHVSREQIDLLWELSLVRYIETNKYQGGEKKKSMSIPFSTCGQCFGTPDEVCIVLSNVDVQTAVGRSGERLRSR